MDESLVPLSVRVSSIIVTLGFSLMAIVSAKAEVTAEERAACTPDALRLCASEIPDVDRVKACMVAKQASLSPQCRAFFQTAIVRSRPTPTRSASRQRRIREADRYVEYRHQAIGESSGERLETKRKVARTSRRRCPPETCYEAGSVAAPYSSAPEGYPGQEGFPVPEGYYGAPEGYYWPASPPPESYLGPWGMFAAPGYYGPEAAPPPDDYYGPYSAPPEEDYP